MEQIIIIFIPQMNYKFLRKSKKNYFEKKKKIDGLCINLHSYFGFI